MENLCNVEYNFWEIMEKQEPLSNVPEIEGGPTPTFSATVFVIGTIIFLNLPSGHVLLSQQYKSLVIWDDADQLWKSSLLV